MKVRDIMTADVACASPEATLEEIAGMMRDEDTGAIPVVEDEVLIGIVTDRDIVLRCVAEGKDAAECTAEDIISENLETIEPDDDVEEAAQIMARRQIRRLPVVEDGHIVGMLSLGDIAVKESEDTAGDALEGVSEGVKQNRRAAQPAVRGDGSSDAVKKRAAARQDLERGEQGTARTLGTGQKLSGQGIGNHDVKEEAKRQSKVVPFRNEGKGKRRVS
jgi:CBS domain-containing protein